MIVVRVQSIFQIWLFGYVEQLWDEIFVFTSSANEKQTSTIAADLNAQYNLRNIVHEEIEDCAAWTVRLRWTPQPTLLISKYSQPRQSSRLVSIKITY